MIFNISVAGFQPDAKFQGCRIGMGVGECDYQTDGKWDPAKIGGMILWRIQQEAKAVGVPFEIYGRD